MDRKKAIPTAQVYPSGNAWYWRLVAANGKIKADGGEDYVTKHAAVKGLQSTLLPPYQIVVMEKLGDVPTEYVGVAHATGLSGSDNPRNYAAVNVEVIR